MPGKNSAKGRRNAGRRTAAGAVPGRRAGRRVPGPLRARDIMTRTPVTVPRDMKVGALCDLLQEMNINGAPVVDERGSLVGVVTQEDIIYGAMGHPTPEESAPARAEAPAGGAPKPAARPSKRVVAILRDRRLQEVPPAPPRQGERSFWAEERPPDPMEMPVGSIMTSPAISAMEDTPVEELCRLMWSLKIHRVPIQRKGKVTGLVSSMDLCRGVLEGKIRI